MNLLESIKKSFTSSPKQDIKSSSSVVPREKSLGAVHGDEIQSAFFTGDNQALLNQLNFSFLNNERTLVAEQADKIETYRNVAYHNSEVKNCITEIVNEVVGTYDCSLPVYLNYNEENKKIKDAVQEAFNEICRLLKLDHSIYNIVEHSYIDGQAICHCTFNENKKGIQRIELIDPEYLFYDRKNEYYTYETSGFGSALYANMATDKKLRYARDEIVRVDFGLYDRNICLSYLEFGLKNANILKGLEDLLLPLRFSRSMTRRIFNIDVGNLPPKRVDEVMRTCQNRFRYKKFYNAKTGEISNQQDVNNLVEDYWFPNRSGSKGTQVEVMDESGNLGELGDVVYFARKLYRSLNVPVSRLSMDSEADHTFDYETTQTSKEDIKFFMFISRIRQVYSDLFKKLLKLQVISSGILTEKEWNEREQDISIKFKNENKFIEKMKLTNLQEALEIYNSASEQTGKIFTVRYLLKEIFKKSDEEIDDLLKQLEDEKNDKRFARYYSSGEEEY